MKILFNINKVVETTTKNYRRGKGPDRLSTGSIRTFFAGPSLYIKLLSKIQKHIKGFLIVVIPC